MAYNLKTFGERFQVLAFYLAKIIEKLIMVCTPHENSHDILFLCVGIKLVGRRHFIITVTKFDEMQAKLYDTAL